MLRQCNLHSGHPPASTRMAHALMQAAAAPMQARTTCGTPAPLVSAHAPQCSNRLQCVMLPGHSMVAPALMRPKHSSTSTSATAGIGAAAITAVTAAAPPSAAPSLLPGLLPVGGPWGVWMALITAGALGLWSEKTRLGKELSGALVATLLGMALANTGVLPHHAPELGVVYKYVLPLAIPMLLFSADLGRMVRETGRLLAAFLLGAAATVGGTLVAWCVFPLHAGGPLGEAGWRIASALTARHIGGAVNYMAVSDTLSIPPSVFGAGLAADDLILTLYFTTIYAMASRIPPDDAPAAATATAAAAAPPTATAATPSTAQAAAAAAAESASDHTLPGATAPQPDNLAGQVSGGHGGGPKRVIGVLEGLTAVSLSALICHLGTGLAGALGMPAQSITIITAITVALATAAPRVLAPLVPSAEGLAQMLMQVFYATIGASANIPLVLATAPVLFAFSALALAAHLGLLLGVGRLLRFSTRDLLLASNANIGGPSTVAGMAAAKGWSRSIVPAILTSTLGYALGTFVGLGLGKGVLQGWAGAAGVAA